MTPSCHTLAYAHDYTGAKAEPFGTKDDESKFHEVLLNWREAVINGSEIKSTAFTKVYKVTFFTSFGFRVYKHYQMENTSRRFWLKESNTSGKAWKAGEKMRNMRAMLHRIEEAVSNGELEEIYLESKKALLDDDADGGVRNMMARVWGVDKVKLYDTTERETQKVEKAQWNKALLEARKKALDKALSAADKRKADKLAKEGKVVTKIRSLFTVLVKAGGGEAAAEDDAAEERAAKAETEAQHVILDIPESKGQSLNEDAQQEFDAKNEEMIKRLKLEIDLELQTQQGHLLDDHQSTVTAEQYSASPPHARARGCTCHEPPHTRTACYSSIYTRRTVHLRIETACDEYMAKVPSLRRSVNFLKGVRLLCTSTAAGCIRAAF